MGVLRVLTVALVVLGLVLPCAAAELAFDGIDEAARDAVASGEIPGAVVLVGRGDQTLFLKAYGSRRVVPSPLPMTVDTIFDVASLTKPLGTTLAVMALVERGAVKLDASLGRYLPEFRKTVFTQVTIERLLRHTAGLAAFPPTRSVKAGFPHAARQLAALPFDYAPGDGFQYSDLGFILLGEVVRRVSGEPLDRYLDRTVFRPLGLRHTTFRPPASLRQRIAPTEFQDGAWLQGRVHDPRARALGGVAGHAGLFSTASELARICRMLANGGVGNGRRLLAAATIEKMWTPSREGHVARGLGWDIMSPFARRLAPFFPPGSVGHTGFTGTAVWIDPASRTYLIILTNRVHPNGGGAARIRELRTRVAAATGAALFYTPPPSPAESIGPAADPPDLAEEPRPRPRPPVGNVRSGLDVLADQKFSSLAGHVVGLVTNQTGVDQRGRRAIDLLAAAPRVKLAAIFSPEHGILGDVSGDVPHGRDPATGVPVWSLYGPTRRPTPAMLKDLSAVVVDLQDVGARYYTYLTTLVYILEEAERRGIRVVVLDRPNPITGRVVEGPLMDPDLESFTGPHAVPVRTGLTIGEFAKLVAGERKLSVALTVVPMTGWDRRLWHDETGLPWVNPSPNIRSVTQAVLYAGIGLLEGTNLSVGRGTDRPFEIVGAPWIDGPALAGALNRLQLPGVRFEPVTFTPSTDRYAREVCAGVRLHVTDREAIRPVTVALALASALRERHRAEWRAEDVQNLLVNRATMWAFLKGEPLEGLMARAEMDRRSFLKRRASYLIY